MTHRIPTLSFGGALLALAAVLSLPLASRSQTIKVAPGAMPSVGTISNRFQSYNIEMLEITGGRFWAPYKTKADAPPDTKQATPGGMPASLYRYLPPIDLSNPRLRKMAAALGPVYLRVSGTWANSTYFQDSDAAAPAKPPKGFNSVLTRKQWRSVIDFAHAVDAKIVTSFAVSAGTRNADGVWTSAQAAKVIDYTKSIGGHIAAAEFFNEPTFAALGGAPKDYNAADYARDFRIFHAFAKKAAPSMMILGPGSVGEVGNLAGPSGMHIIRSEDMLKDQGPGLLDGFSYHFYGTVSERCARMGHGLGTTPEAALSDNWLSRTNRDEAYYSALRDRFAPGKPLWLTETAEAACGGDPWAADFIDSFRYLNQLGTLARHGVQVVMHNTLSASDYAYIDGDTLTPRPNYWAAVLWRRLMGTTVLNAGRSSAPSLYLYAQCQPGKPGGVTLLAINASRTATRKLALPVAASRYTLSSGDLLSTTVKLNNVALRLKASGDLPALNGRQQKAGTVSLSPETITFLAMPKANNPACR